jgi:hypothetical protein
MLVRNKVGKGIIAGVAAVFLAITLFTSVKLTSNFIEGDFQITFDDDSDSSYSTTEYSEPITPVIKNAKFFMDAGVGSFKIKTSTEELIFVKTIGIENNYNLTRTDSDSVSELNLKMKETKIHLGKNDLTNRVDISLSEEPFWDLNLNVGASAINLDLRKFKIENVDIDMGAASLDIKLGDLTEKTNLKINAGASEINIKVPKNAGCQVRLDDVLSSKDLRRFEKINSGLYQTSDFDKSEKKIYIKIDCGVSSINVRRY